MGSSHLIHGNPKTSRAWPSMRLQNTGDSSRLRPQAVELQLLPERAPETLDRRMQSWLSGRTAGDGQ